jgi:hypothetical protein
VHFFNFGAVAKLDWEIGRLVRQLEITVSHGRILNGNQTGLARLHLIGLQH